MDQVFKPTYKEAHHWASSFLLSHEKDEAIAYHFLLDLADISPGQWLLVQNKMMPEAIWQVYQSGLKRIITDDYPWQYIIGFSWFYGYKFKVTESSLIPRQETEQLVEEIHNRIQAGEIARDAKIVDIGTGSGVIAIMLKLLVPTLIVTATDISFDALAVAKKNAQLLSVDITFKQGNLYQPVAGQIFDVIVSNPPYIGADEVDTMGEDVIKYEPKEALFAEDAGYALYWQLLAGLPESLSESGWFFAEFGYRQGEALRKRYQAALSDSEVEIKQDYAGLDRMLIVHYKNKIKEVNEND